MTEECSRGDVMMVSIAYFVLVPIYLFILFICLFLVGQLGLGANQNTFLLQLYDYHMPLVFFRYSRI